MLPTTALLAPMPEGVPKRGQETAKAPTEAPTGKRNRGAETDGFADMVALGQPTADPDLREQAVLPTIGGKTQAAGDLPLDGMPANPENATAANRPPVEANGGHSARQAGGITQLLDQPNLASAATGPMAGLTANAASSAKLAPTSDTQLARSTTPEATASNSPELLSGEDSLPARSLSDRSVHSPAARGSAPGTVNVVGANEQSTPATAVAVTEDGATAQDSLSGKGVSASPNAETAIGTKETIARPSDSPVSQAQAPTGAFRGPTRATEEIASPEHRATGAADGGPDAVDGTGNAREAAAKQRIAAPSETPAPLSRGIDATDTVRPEPPNGADTAVSGAEPRTEAGSLRNDASRDIHRPAILREALPQIVETVRSNGQGTIELTLNPEELGRIRMSMSAGEAGLQVTIQSDRAETAELLRRHIALLRDELAGLGYTQVDIGFGGRNPSQPPTSPVPEPTAEQSGSVHMAATPSGDAPSDHRTAMPARLDMRL